MCTDCQNEDIELKLNIAIDALRDIVRGHAVKDSGMSTQPTNYTRDALRLKAQEALQKINAE